METATLAQTTKFFIGDTEITLEEKGENKGEITVKDYRMGIYSMYWGAMGGTLKNFILRINEDYFTDKLLGVHSMYVFDIKATFKELRKFIRHEFNLPWYKHTEFQKDLRVKLKNFQDNCEEYKSERYFVDDFNFYLGIQPDFYLIEDKFECNHIEKSFKSIEEPWSFIQQKDSDTTKWLKKLHNKIKLKLRSDEHCN